LDHRTNFSRKVRAPRRVRASGAPNKFQNCHLDKTNMNKTSQHQYLCSLFVFFVVVISNCLDLGEKALGSLGVNKGRTYSGKYICNILYGNNDHVRLSVPRHLRFWGWGFSLKKIGFIMQLWCNKLNKTKIKHILQIILLPQ